MRRIKVYSPYYIFLVCTFRLDILIFLITSDFQNGCHDDLRLDIDDLKVSITALFIRLTSVEV